MPSSPLIEGYGPSKLADVELGRKMIEALEHYYPNHAFYVECNHEGGQLTIQLLYEDASGRFRRWSHGMLIHLRNLTGHPEIRRYAKLFGGELLERYHLAREGANPYTRPDAKSRAVDTAGMA